MGSNLNIRAKARTWAGFGRAEKRLLLHALWLLPVVAASLRLFGLRRTQAWLGRGPFPVRLPASDEQRAEVRRAAQMLKVARRYHRWWTNCLSHSVTLWAMLRRRGIDSNLRIGVRGGNEADFAAHAWLEWQGEVLTDTEDVHERYQAFGRKDFSTTDER